MDYENENSNQGYHLEELSNSDYEIKDGEPDIIGWDVRNNGGGKLGEVDELIFDPQARKVRYIVLNMEGNDLDLEDERRVLIPIGIANLHTDKDEVVVPLITELQLAQLPPYESCPKLTPELEMNIRRAIEGEAGSTAPYDHPQFYEHEHFDEDRFYNRGNDSTIVADEASRNGDERAARTGRIVERLKRSDKDEPIDPTAS
ncbi:PRC-barrel domain-containing protein [Mucilaginibacter sp. CAU 1740]|uniref:PRC-barrel domain-containing protein n=1 Tax=Mucilaginibacter sp. CAU 1740 TaxID=3140365 RepID=UPI00325B064D